MHEILNALLKLEIVFIQQEITNTKNSGIPPSLGYREGMLFATFENDGNIGIKNLSEYIPLIDEKTTDWKLKDKRPEVIEKIKVLPHLN
ncbi:hypothetical protein EV697_10449 [Bisgaardia hudsonensis]|uniref:Uncharacterized protein n=2 Tax=Bisgaardia hudsonensis TaxID=109472 RepID=A0A4R2MXR2_9PAST|nr:hypothetical protein EV697_10449 [Bisgaardia hudsonensis]